MLLAVINKVEWLAVGQHEVLFGPINQNTKCLEIQGRKEFSPGVLQQRHPEIRFAPYAHELNVLILCFADGKIVAIENPLKAEMALESPRVITVEGIAGILATNDSIQFLTIDGQALQYRRSVNSDAFVYSVGEKTINCDKAFLVSEATWVAETKNGVIREISVIKMVTCDFFRWVKELNY